MDKKPISREIAHTIRTPLSVIKTNTEIILLNTSLDNTTKEMLNSNIEELDKLSDLIKGFTE